MPLSHRVAAELRVKADKYLAAFKLHVAEVPLCFVTYEDDFAVFVSESPRHTAVLLEAVEGMENPTKVMRWADGGTPFDDPQTSEPLPPRITGVTFSGDHESLSMKVEVSTPCADGPPTETELTFSFDEGLRDALADRVVMQNHAMGFAATYDVRASLVFKLLREGITPTEIGRTLEESARTGEPWNPRGMREDG